MISVLKNFYIKHKDVVENYFFMTVLQVLNSAFYLLIYPYLIKSLGPDSYGLFVFLYAIINYFIGFVNFGFDMPSIKHIANKTYSVDYIVSIVLTAKIYLLIISILILFALSFFTSIVSQNILLILLFLPSILSNIFLPRWYFQALQRMKIVTVVVLLARLMSVPFILLFVNEPQDLYIYIIIFVLTGLVTAIISMYIIIVKDNVKVKLIDYHNTVNYIKESFAFFLSTFAGILKEQSLSILIGLFLTMKDVALYDLANKIIQFPRILVLSINGAIFPKLIRNYNLDTARLIIKYQFLIGVLIVFLVLVTGNWAVKFLGGGELNEAFTGVIILSFTVLSHLVIGAYIDFIFIPNNMYYTVTFNQIISLISMLLLVVVFFGIFKSLNSLILAISLTGLFEYIYCVFKFRKNKISIETKWINNNVDKINHE